MKKILFIILSLVFITSIGMGQVPGSRKLLGQDTSSNTGGKLYFDTLKTLVCSGCTFLHGLYSDTIVITGGSGGGNNLYNIDSTLSSIRTVTMAGRTIQWSGGNFGIGDRVPTQLLDVYKTASSPRILVATGLSTGFAMFEADNDGANAFQMGIYSSAAASSGLVVAGDAFIQSNVANHFVIQTLGTNKPIIFGINAVERARIDATNVTLTAALIANGTSAFNNSVTQTFTLPASPGTGVAAIAHFLNVTSTGSNSSFGPINLYAPLAAGYTGNQETRGVYTNNGVAGTSGSYDNANGFAVHGNEGVLSYASATTTGIETAVEGIALGGNTNYGGFFSASFAKNSATNIGVAGFGLNTGTSPIQIGGYFALYTSASAAPTYTSAALIANNGSTTSPIAKFQDNGTDIVSILDGGDILIGSSTDNSTGLTQITKTTAQLALHYDATNYTTFNAQSAGGITITPSSASGGVNIAGDLIIAGTNQRFVITGNHAGITTLSSGVATFTVTGAASSSSILAMQQSATTSTLTVKYKGVCTTNSCTITATKADETTNTADGSTVMYLVVN